jgi:hypothetical protein
MTPQSPAKPDSSFADWLREKLVPSSAAIDERVRTTPLSYYGAVLELIEERINSLEAVKVYMGTNKTFATTKEDPGDTHSAYLIGIQQIKKGVSKREIERTIETTYESSGHRSQAYEKLLKRIDQEGLAHE